MRAFKYILSIIIALALCAGVLIYALGEQAPKGSAEAPSEKGSVVINEFMASNKGYLPDDHGKYSDWIEIHNPTASDINLSGMGLSDDMTNIKWAFPRVTLAAGGYLVVFASGSDIADADTFHTNFKLNASSGGIYLTSASGQLLDRVEYENQTGNISLGRDPQDINTWKAFEKATPGFANDEAGYAAFQESRIDTEARLLITEVMASNKTTIRDNTGTYSDYIEIYNAGSEAVRLKGYGLSDDPANVLDWRFPDVTIEPGAYLVVFASGADLDGTDLEAGTIHTSYRLSAYQETVVLSNPLGLLIDQVTVNESKPDRAYARVLDENGNYSEVWEHTTLPSPGYANTNAGHTEFVEANPVALGPVVINEIMASNSEYLQEDNGRHYDWIELYNRSDQAVDITGYGLTDNTGNPAKWRMPEMTLAPGAYMTVLASGLADNEEVKKNYVHTSFKLSAAGDVLALFDDDGALQDRYYIQPVPHGVSIGRTDGQDSLFYYAEPTPGAKNASPLKGIVDTPGASVSGGSYGAPQTLALSCDTEGAVIRYTTDGTTPTQNSTAYSGAIQIDKTSMIRVKAFKDGYLNSTVRTETYLIGAQHSLPVVSIVTDPANLWDEKTGIYAKGADAEDEYPYIGANFFEEWEKPASFEVFNENGEQVFAQNVAIRIAGGYSRGREQKSFAIFARSAYGPNSLKHAFFENRPFDEYESLLLRQGGQDQNIAKIKEIVALSLVENQGFNFITQAFKPYVLYLNGEYWGVYFMMEKRNKDFVAQNEGTKYEDNINLLKATSIILRGTNEGYKEILKYIETHDMSKEESYDYVAARIDTDSFMDLMINQIWVANTDYANLQFYQILPDGKWKQVYYDFCWTFGSSSFPNGEHPTLTMRMDNTKAGSTVLNGLLKYKPWRDKFIERFAWALKEIYPPDRVIATIDSVADMIRSEMPAERAKFGGTVEGWEKQVENMKVFAKKRGANVVQQLKSTFSLSQEQINMLEDAIRYND